MVNNNEPKVDPLAAKHAALIATPWRDRVDPRHFIPGPASWSNIDGEGGLFER